MTTKLVDTFTPTETDDENDNEYIENHRSLHDFHHQQINQLKHDINNLQVGLGFLTFVGGFVFAYNRFR